ncbi:MAG: CcmD family protein [Deltaproteobacteria bacterium]
MRRIGKKTVLAALAMFGVLTFAPLGVALAQTSTTAAVAPAKKPPPGFEKVAGAPDTEKIDASRLVVAAYIAIFVGVFGYVVYVARSQAAMAKEMESLASRIDKGAS